MKNEDELEESEAEADNNPTTKQQKQCSNSGRRTSVTKQELLPLIPFRSLGNATNKFLFLFPILL